MSKRWRQRLDRPILVVYGQIWCAFGVSWFDWWSWNPILSVAHHRQLFGDLLSDFGGEVWSDFMVFAASGLGPGGGLIGGDFGV